MNTIIPKSDIRQDEPTYEPKMSSRVRITLATSMEENLRIAHQALMNAKSMAFICDLPLVNRISEVESTVYSLARDARRVRGDIENGEYRATQPETMSVDVANKLVNLMPALRQAARDVKAAGRYTANEGNDMRTCLHLESLGILERTSECTFRVTTEYEAFV